MNYLLVSYQALIQILILVIAVLVVTIFLYFAGWLTVFFKLSQKVSVFLFIVFVSGSFVSSCFFLYKLEDNLNHGVIKELFILDSDGNPLLTLWLMRVHKIKKGSFYDQRLETFELESGKAIGMVEMQHRKEASNYRLYWPFGSKTIWGIDENEKAQLFSLTQPGFLKNTDPVPKFIENARDGWYNRVANFKQRGWYEKGWTFRGAIESLGQNLIGPEGKLDSKSTTLLNPVFIEELSTKPEIKNKIWIFHKSGIHNNIEPLISYVDFNGKELNRINLNKIFSKTKVRPCAIYTGEKEVMVFVTCGDNKKAYLAENLGFTLSALRFDRSAGKYIGRIDYIK